MALTVEKVVEQFGSYYKKGQNNRSRLFEKIMQPGETLAVEGIRHLRTDETVYEAVNVTQGSVIQPYKHEFSAMGDTKFTPNVIQLAKMKVDVKIAPDDIEDNWLGFLAGDSQKLAEWPVVRYILEQLIAGKIVEDRELQMVYKGEKAATGGPSAAMNGLKKILKDSSASTHPYPIHVVEGVEALDKSDIFDQVEKFEDAIPGMMKNRRMVLFVAPEMAMAYFRKLRALGFYDVTNAEGLSMKVDKTNHTLIGVPSMAGTTDIFATMPENILHITKRSDEAGNFNMQEVDRDVKILGHWYEGVGFADNDLVYTTEETVSE